MRAAHDQRGLTEYAVLLGVIMLGIAALLLLMRGAPSQRDDMATSIERPGTGSSTER